MIIHLRLWLGRLLFLVVFLLLVIMLSGGYDWLRSVFIPLDPYRMPSGAAVKVSTHFFLTPDSTHVGERLLWFLYHGE